MEFKTVKKLKAYFDSVNDSTYQSVMDSAKKDPNFEKMVQDMTLGRITGKSKFDKLKRF